MITIKQLERSRRRAAGVVVVVVVVGAGFGGLAAVRRLARAGFRTTLIDRNVYATFQPLLYQVATAGLASSDVAYPARARKIRRSSAGCPAARLAKTTGSSRDGSSATCASRSCQASSPATESGSTRRNPRGAAELSADWDRPCGPGL